MVVTETSSLDNYHNRYVTIRRGHRHGSEGTDRGVPAFRKLSRGNIDESYSRETADHHTTQSGHDSTSFDRLPTFAYFYTPSRISAENKFSSDTSEVPWTQLEHIFINELLDLLLGVDETPHLAIDAATDSIIYPRFIDTSLQSVICGCETIVQHYRTIARFVESSVFVESRVLQALGASMRGFLHEHLMRVAQIENELRSDRSVGATNLHVHAIWYYLQPSRHMLQHLHSVVCVIYPRMQPAPTSVTVDARHSSMSPEDRSTHTSAQLLSVLYERLSTCEEQAHSIYARLMADSSRAYMQMLERWIYEGTIDDPHGEFCVVEDQSISASVELHRYWQHCYVLVPERVCSFLHDKADIILRAGKYLNVVKHSSTASSIVSASRADYIAAAPDDSVSGDISPRKTLVYSHKDRLYIAAIDDAYRTASIRLLRLLLDEKDLIGHLKSMRNYYWMKQGDFIAQIIDLFAPELNKSINDIVVTRVQSLLELALRTSAANCDPHKDALYLEFIETDLHEDVANFLDTSSTARSGARSATLAATATCRSNTSITGDEAFLFSTRVDWPMSLIINERTIRYYQTVFRLLFQCKHVEWLLCGLWRTCYTPARTPSAQPHHMLSSWLRHRMLIFVQNILYYMTCEVLEPTWIRLLDCIAHKAQDFDEVLRMHQAALNSCLKDCMLTRVELLRPTLSLLTYCRQYVLLIQQRAEIAGSAMHDNKDLMAGLRRLDRNFNDTMLVFMQNISDFRRHFVDSDFIGLWCRLDFNSFYSRLIGQRRLGGGARRTGSAHAGLANTSSLRSQ